MANIPISSLPLVESVSDSDYLAVDSGSVSSKITVAKFNETGTASARAYAEAAAQSASAASDSAGDALTYKNTIESELNDASTIVSNAQTYANAAESSKNDASGYASAASTSASQAATSATQAASYATGVQAYAIEAKSYAEGGTGTRVDEETDNAKYYAQAAGTAETNAAASESNAAASESNAADSATAAAAAATSVGTNALKAEGYAVGTQNGVPVESGSTYYENNAKYYKEEAADSASNAASSEYNAGLSESAAFASETAAKGSEEDSEAWAWGKIDGVDVPSTHPAYHNNAKYWADAASGGATGGVTSFNGRSGIVTPESGDYDAGIIPYDNTSSGMTADDVQEAIDELKTDLGTLDSSLATVAKSGAYSDLRGTPTLGTAAALDAPASGNASTTQVVKGDDSRLTDSRTPVSHTHTKSEITDFPTLGTAAAKNVPASGNASNSEVVLGSDSRLSDARTPTSHTHTVSQITDYAATSIGYTGTASAGGVRYQRVGIGSSYTEINGTKYMEQTKTLSTSGSTTYSFSNSAITTDSVIEPYSSIYGIVPESITVSSGSCSVVIPKYSSAASCKIRIYIR